MCAYHVEYYRHDNLDGTYLIEITAKPPRQRIGRRNWAGLGARKDEPFRDVDIVAMKKLRTADNLKNLVLPLERRRRQAALATAS